MSNGAARPKRVRGAALALVLILSGCADRGSFSGPPSPRDGAGRAVDAVYGTPQPGTDSITGGM